MRTIFKEHDDETQVKERNDNLTQKIHELVATVNLLRQVLVNKDLIIVQIRRKCQQLEKDNNKLEKRCGEYDCEMRKDNIIFSRLNIEVADAVSDESSSSRLVKQVSEICFNKLQHAIETRHLIYLCYVSQEVTSTFTSIFNSS